MKILQTARICIIDDEPDEYLQLIHALSRIGLGCLHIDGSKEEELPKSPLAGLRMVFLDMHLGTAGDANQVAAQTAQVFSRVVAQDGGPVLVVFWTKHNDYVEAFKIRLFGKWSSFLGRLVFARMDKPQVSTKIDPKKLEADVCAHLGKHQPLDLIWEWEQAVHEAASDTTSALAKLAAERAGVVNTDDELIMAGKIQSAFKFLLRLLLDASAGRNATEDSALRDLHSGLAPLHNDRLEHSSIVVGKSSAPLLLKEKKPEPTFAEAAAINSMLLIAPIDGDTAKLEPGSLYTFTEAAMFKQVFGQEWVKVAEKILDPFKIKPADQPAVIEQCRPVLAEVSADCDYAQKKCPVARLVSGVLVPSDLAKKLDEAKQFRSADYLRHGTDVSLKKPQGDWRPVFIGQFVFSLSPAVLPAWIQPIGRLRTGPLAELRHWLASHTTRPGYVTV
jgi:hypothetical protein